ncbi:MAG: hypothetical protein IPO41_05560 [Acidobacteria bacterium]|nr:hypothetical protein [Acidobacteriota bacterium]
MRSDRGDRQRRQTSLVSGNTAPRQFAVAGINLNSSGLAGLPNVTPTQIATIASGLGLSANPFVGATVTSHASDFKNPRSSQFGFAVEHEFRNNFVIGLDYSFVKTDRIQRNRDINVPGPLTGAEYAAFLQANNTPANYAAWVANGPDQYHPLSSGLTYIARLRPAG